jgi:hypothetical protein
MLKGVLEEKDKSEVNNAEEKCKHRQNDQRCLEDSVAALSWAA